jgi:hypothetical protein
MLWEQKSAKLKRLHQHQQSSHKYHMIKDPQLRMLTKFKSRILSLSRAPIQSIGMLHLLKVECSG